MTNSSIAATAAGILIGDLGSTLGIGSPVAAIAGTLTINGGTLSVTSGGTTPAITLARVASGITGAHTISGTLNINAGTVTVNNRIAAGARAAGSAAVVTSEIHLDDGTLNMAGFDIGSSSNPLTNLNVQSGSISNSGNVYVNGTLGGGGTVSFAAGKGIVLAGTSGTTSGQAVLAPGNSIGTLMVGGNVTFGNNSSLATEIDSAAPGQKVDLLSLTSGTISLAGGLDALYLSGTLSSGASYTIAQATAITGTFDAVYWNGSPVSNPTLGGIGDGGSYKLDYTGTEINLVQIPEPATASMLMMAGMALTALRRRRV